MQEIIITLLFIVFFVFSYPFYHSLPLFQSIPLSATPNLEEILLNALGTEVLGIAFLLVGTAATFLMFYQWGFSYDKDLHRSEAPPWVTLSLRILGYLYLFISPYMMLAMIPRLWTDQVELPARTVAHLVIGIAIGAIFILKISIVRFFKYLEKP